MAQNVADLMWKMLEKAGVKRCYGIIGDALPQSATRLAHWGPKKGPFRA